MKKRHKLIDVAVIFLIGCIGWISLNINAQSNAFIDVEDEALTHIERDMMDEKTSLAVELEKLLSVKSFQTTFSLMNTRSKETTYTVNVKANQETGNAIIEMNMYNRLANPNHYTLTFYTYNHFQYVYVNVIEWLNSMAYFQQAYFPAQLQEEMENYSNYFIAVDSEKIHKNEQILDFVRSFLLLANPDKLQTIDNDAIYQLEDFYFVALSRTQIPEMLFRDISSVAFDYSSQINYEAQKYYFQHELSFDVPMTGLAYRVGLESQLTHPLESKFFELNAQRILPDMTKDFIIATGMVTDKLTDTTLSYHTESLRYKLQLNGITENFNLNLFNNQSANFRSYEFQINYEFTPLEWTMPELLSLNRLSVEEFNYILEGLMTQTIQ